MLDVSTGGSDSLAHTEADIATSFDNSPSAAGLAVTGAVTDGAVLDPDEVFFALLGVALTLELDAEADGLAAAFPAPNTVSVLLVEDLEGACAALAASFRTFAKVGLPPQLDTAGLRPSASTDESAETATDPASLFSFSESSLEAFFDPLDSFSSLSF